MSAVNTKGAVIIGDSTVSAFLAKLVLQRVFWNPVKLFMDDSGKTFQTLNDRNWANILFFKQKSLLQSFQIRVCIFDYKICYN